MLRKVLVFALTSGLAAKLAHHFLQTEGERAKSRKKRQEKAELHRWEDEGGTVIEPRLPQTAETAR
jgi:hypothetical protein